MPSTGYQSITFLIACLRRVTDRGSYFETSASCILTPPEALEEASEALHSYCEEPDQTWKAVSYSLERCQYAISHSVLRQSLMQLPHTKALLDYLREFLRAYKNKNSRQQISYLQEEISNLNSLVTNASHEISIVYFNNLINRTIKALSHDTSQASNRDKAHAIAPELAAALFYQGRDVHSLADRIEQESEAILESPNSRTPEEIVRKQLSAKKSAFYVATVITGAVTATISKDLRGRTIDFPGPIYWIQDSLNPRKSSPKYKHPKRSSRNNSYADADLAQFCFEHWKASPTSPSSSHRIPSQIVVWAVKAWDHEQARQAALDNAESVMDLVNAEHRTGEFGVKRKVLIWKTGDKMTTYVADSPGSIFRTRMMKPHSSPSVKRSLRFASRSANERAGAMAVFFGWVALEYLGRGNTYQLSAQSFIAKFAPKVVAMAAWHHLANEISYVLTKKKPLHEMADDLQRVLEFRTKNRDHLDQKHLLLLLVADDLQSIDDPKTKELAENLDVNSKTALAAKRELTYLIKSLSEVEQYRIRKIRGLFSSAEKLNSYLRNVEESAEVTLQRMRYVRNQTAHSSIPESLRYRMLSNATREILDTCFQALDKANSESTPSESLHIIATNYDRLLDSLNRADLTSAYSPYSALHPQTTRSQN